MPTAKSKSEVKKAPGASAAKSKPEFSVSEEMSVSPEQRYQMIMEAAYFRAETRGFVGGDPAQDWLEAEVEIDRMLQGLGQASQITEKQAFQKKLEAQLAEWDAKIEELKEKALKAKDEMRADFERQLEAIASKRATVQAKAHELRLRSEGAWGDLKGGTEKAWDEMRKALDQIVSRFK